MAAVKSSPHTWKRTDWGHVDEIRVDSHFQKLKGQVVMIYMGTVLGR